LVVFRFRLFLFPLSCGFFPPLRYSDVVAVFIHHLFFESFVFDLVTNQLSACPPSIAEGT